MFPFEGLGAILPWLNEREWQVSLTELYRDEPLPSINDIDWPDSDGRSNECP